MDDFDAIGLLQEPLRRRLYEYVVAQDHDVSRNEAAEATGMQRTLVAFHLDKLAEAGLLETARRRLSGRSGPGAGRPAKLYRRAASERQVALPPRDYRTVATLLADAAEAARLDDELQAAARRRGAELREGASPVTLDAALALLAERGYEPYVDGAVVRMRNCPFHALAESHPALVCGMNLALLEGLVDGSVRFTAALDARPGECCTVLQISKSNGG
jgi:predicted ArsR family transcriptional regulator